MGATVVCWKPIASVLHIETVMIRARTICKPMPFINGGCRRLCRERMQSTKMFSDPLHVCSGMQIQRTFDPSASRYHASFAASIVVRGRAGSQTHPAYARTRHPVNISHQSQGAKVRKQASCACGLLVPIISQISHTQHSVRRSSRAFGSRVYLAGVL